MNRECKNPIQHELGLRFGPQSVVSRSLIRTLVGIAFLLLDAIDSTMRTFATYLLLSLIVLIGGGNVSAQEHPFLSEYSLNELPNGVLITWTIHGGTTCDGQEVQRSTDSLNFTRIHLIQGICGSPDSSTPYIWFDPSPPEFSKVYYRLKLGFDGYSSVKSVFFQQLNESKQRFFPNPVSDVATLIVDVPLNTTVDVRIRNTAGALVWERLAQPGPAVELDVNELPAGPYVYQAIGNGRSFSGRFVKN